MRQHTAVGRSLDTCKAMAKARHQIARVCVMFVKASPVNYVETLSSLQQCPEQNNGKNQLFFRLTAFSTYVRPPI